MTSAPANTTMLTVYHLIAAVGSIQIDDASLSLPQAPDLTSGVPNGSFEQVSDLNPNLPLAWSSASTGDNDATFVYETNGHTGSRLGWRETPWTPSGFEGWTTGARRSILPFRRRTTKEGTGSS